MRDLSRIVKAYDIRGVVPDELDEDAAYAIGAAFARFAGGSTIVTAHDMRDSSGPLATAFADGVTGQGADIVAAGLGSTDLLYFAASSLNLPGAMFTASHNPAKYNGIKLCLAGAAPVGQDSGLARVRALASEELEPVAVAGTVHRRELLADYAAHLRRLVDLSRIRPVRVAVDAGNGMAGLTVPAVFAGLPLTVVPLYFDLDGTFPNHEANPIDPANLRDLQAAVLDSGADIGLAFDGDADRCFVVDERGELVSPSTLTALIATRELAKLVRDSDSVDVLLLRHGRPAAVILSTRRYEALLEELEDLRDRLSIHEREGLTVELDKVLAELGEDPGGRDPARSPPERGAAVAQAGFEPRDLRLAV
jgi:phosphomannomutase